MSFSKANVSTEEPTPVKGNSISPLHPVTLFHKTIFYSETDVAALLKISTHGAKGASPERVGTRTGRKQACPRNQVLCRHDLR